ncbi:WD40 repeat domain-containing protein [Amorphus orientalis]|uniref:WD40 repeat protein n=1 Tax=Amorphus orientalis TaxID=649198 RepID=A0AAE3VSV0_9HYPH|nr:hypothetical protein [Amorphus orientalis]MDQ0317732.1 WD40 repeat protein [Amorphus orientalis]
MTKIIAKKLNTFPFIEVIESGTYGEDPVTFDVEPPLAAALEGAEFSYKRNQAALVNDLRVEGSELFGSDIVPIPQDGIRVFSDDDRFLLFGGDSEGGPLLMRRAGPTYMRRNETIEFPGVLSFAAFADHSRLLAMIATNNPGTIEIQIRDEDENFRPHEGLDDPMELDAPVGTVEELSFTPDFAFLHCRTDQESTLFSTDEDVFSDVGFPSTGRILAVSPDSRFFVVDDGDTTDPLTVYLRDGLTFTPFGTLQSSDGNNRKATFDPEGDVLTATAGGYLQIYHLYPEDGWVRSGGIGNPGDVAFSRDGSMMYNRQGLYGKTSEEILPFAAEFTIVDGAFSPDGTRFAYSTGSEAGFTIASWDGETLTTIQQSQTAVPGAMGTRFAWSSDGSALAMESRLPGEANDQQVEVWKWDGNLESYIQNTLPSSIVGGGGTFDWLSWYADDRLICGFSNGGVTILNFDGSVFTRPYDISFAFFSGEYIKSRSATSDGKLFVATNKACYIFELGEAAATRLPNLPMPTWFDPLGPSSQIGAVAPSYDRSRVLVNFGSTGSTPYLVLMVPSGSTYSIVDERFGDVSSAPVDGNLVTFSPGGDRVLVDTYYELELFSLVGDTLELEGRISLIGVPGATPGSISGLDFVSGALRVDGGFYKASDPYTLYSYAFLSGPGVGGAANDGFSPNGEIVHTTGEHRAVDDLGTPLTHLSFEHTYPADQVTDVQYSNSGNHVLWENPDGVALAVRRPDDTFIEVERLTGTFVTVYEIDREDYVLREKGYEVHAEGAVVTDMVFSQSPVAFSYFVSDEGRQVYNTALEDAYFFKGTEYDEDMLASFLAFSPSESHFAATYQRDDGGHYVVLYKFMDGDLNYEETDRKTVEFGPVDFSGCASIVVAHGGEQPFSVFDVDLETDTLIEKEIPQIDWETEGLILDVKFADCDNLVLLTEDEVINYESDGETGDWAITDEVDRDDRGGDRLDQYEGDDNFYVRPGEPGGGGGPGDGGGGGYGWDGGVLTPRTYIPYVAVNVFYRE